MSRRVRIAELKTRLSEHLRYVRRGGSITVLDRQTPIARLESYARSGQPLVVRPAAGSFAKMKFPRLAKLEIDPVALLLQDRHSSR